MRVIESSSYKRVRDVRGLAREFFDRAYRVQKTDTSIPLEERFAGANVRIPPDVHSILDVGCGTGEFLRWLPDMYLKVSLDISSEALTQVGTPKVLGNVDSLPFATSSFDLVTCFEVLEHLPHRTFPLALKELEGGQPQVHYGVH